MVPTQTALWFNGLYAAGQPAGSATGEPSRDGHVHKSHGVFAPDSSMQVELLLLDPGVHVDETQHGWGHPTDCKLPVHDRWTGSSYIR